MKNLDNEKFNDEQLDKIIKEKFKQDTIISEKANSIFANFNPQVELKNSIESNSKIEENTKVKQINFQAKEDKQKEEKVNVNKNVIDALFYKRLNKFLSVAAVSLTVVLVGGTTLYFNKDKIQNISENNQNETVVYTQDSIIKNKPLQYSNEQVVKEVENAYIKAYLIGKSDVGVEFFSSYWDAINKQSIKVPSETYKIDGINGNIKDIFVGCTGNSGLPYIFVLMEDSTAMYVDLHGYGKGNTNLYYYAVPIQGLTDIVGFEEKTRNYSYSKSEYTYVNAIRSDGKRKEIEIGEVNDWDDTSTKTFDKYNQKYISAHNGVGIPDDNKGDFEVDGIQYWTVNIDNRYVYCFKGQFMNENLYRIERSTGKQTLMASGVSGMARDNKDGRISIHVNSNGNYTIYEIDDNIIYRDNENNSIITEVTAVRKEQNKQEDYSIFNEYKGHTYKNEDYNTNTVSNQGVIKEYCELKIDENGKPTIKTGYKSDKNTEYYFETKDISNFKAEGAAGTTYVTFDFTALTPSGSAKGNATISFNNVSNDYTMIVSAKVNYNTGTKEYKNITVKQLGQTAMENFIISQFKNRVYEGKDDLTGLVYKLEFDESGKPTITIISSNEADKEKEYKYTYFTNISIEVAAGSSYIKFSYILSNEEGDNKVEGRLRYSNNTDNNEVYLKMHNVKDDGDGIELKRVK